MVALCGAHLIKELAYLRSFLPSCTEKDNNREGMALPCENPEGNNVQHIYDDYLYSHERYSHEEFEEVIEEIKPSLFSADASSSQHRASNNRFQNGMVSLSLQITMVARSFSFPVLGGLHHDYLCWLHVISVHNMRLLRTPYSSTDIPSSQHSTNAKKVHSL